MSEKPFSGKSNAEQEQVLAGVTSPVSKEWSPETETPGRLPDHSPLCRRMLMCLIHSYQPFSLGGGF